MGNIFSILINLTAASHTPPKCGATSFMNVKQAMFVWRPNDPNYMQTRTITTLAKLETEFNKIRPKQGLIWFANYIHLYILEIELKLRPRYRESDCVIIKLLITSLCFPNKYIYCIMNNHRIIMDLLLSLHFLVIFWWT